ncbi:hypothetical protein [uncultured Jannaschia sp.]|uniref:hypothetical protein n=1 Tax=uncultured Jannaschia sp. TaxID=293347 RepID=UPI00261D3D49|nr:hypothetical protein [uncultured Jannaschia sp.]
MPLDRLVLILVAAILAAGATIWLAAIMTASIAVPFGWAAILPVLPIAYLAWRVIVDRRANPDDDRYDRMGE